MKGVDSLRISKCRVCDEVQSVTDSHANKVCNTTGYCVVTKQKIIDLVVTDTPSTTGQSVKEDI